MLWLKEASAADLSAQVCLGISTRALAETAAFLSESPSAELLLAAGYACVVVVVVVVAVVVAEVVIVEVVGQPPPPTTSPKHCLRAHPFCTVFTVLSGCRSPIATTTVAACGVGWGGGGAGDMMTYSLRAHPFIRYLQYFRNVVVQCQRL